MGSFKPFYVLACAAFLSCVACNTQSTCSSTTQSTSSPPQSDGAAEPAESASIADTANETNENPNKVSVETKNWDELQTWVKSQQGKVVVVDLWSTWCSACVREFPHFVELHNGLGKDVACASLSLDYAGSDGQVPDDVKEQVLEFLQTKTATMMNFIASEGDEAIMKQVDVASIPAALVYDREGKLHKVFKNDHNEYGDKGFNYVEHITPLVQQLLKN